MLEKVCSCLSNQYKRQIYRFDWRRLSVLLGKLLFAGLIVNCLTLEQVCKRVVFIAFRLIQNLTGLNTLNT